MHYNKIVILRKLIEFKEKKFNSHLMKKCSITVLSMKYQSYPKLRKIDAFERKICNVTALVTDNFPLPKDDLNLLKLRKIFLKKILKIFFENCTISLYRVSV